MDYTINPDYHYLIIGAYRKGAIRFLTRLEYELFTPGTELNDKFEVYTINHMGCSYIIVGFHKEAQEMETIEKLADEYDLLICNGKPAIVTATSTEHFPFDHSPDSVWTVVNKNLHEFSSEQLRQQILDDKQWLEEYLNPKP